MRRKVIPRAGLLHPEHFTRFCSQCVGDDVDEGDFAFTVGAPKAIQARSRGERDLCQGFFTLLRLCSLCFLGEVNKMEMRGHGTISAINAYLELIRARV